MTNPLLDHHIAHLIGPDYDLPRIASIGSGLESSGFADRVNGLHGRASLQLAGLQIGANVLQSATAVSGVGKEIQKSVIDMNNTFKGVIGQLNSTTDKLRTCEKQRDDAKKEVDDLKDRLALKETQKEETAKMEQEQQEEEVAAQNKKQEEDASKKKKEEEEEAQRKLKEEVAASEKTQEKATALKKKQEETATLKKKKEEEAAAVVEKQQKQEEDELKKRQQEEEDALEKQQKKTPEKTPEKTPAKTPEKIPKFLRNNFENAIKPIVYQSGASYDDIVTIPEIPSKEEIKKGFEVGGWTDVLENLGEDIYKVNWKNFFDGISEAFDANATLTIKLGSKSPYFTEEIEESYGTFVKYLDSASEVVLSADKSSQFEKKFLPTVRGQTFGDLKPKAKVQHILQEIVYASIYLMRIVLKIDTPEDNGLEITIYEVFRATGVSKQK